MNPNTPSASAAGPGDTLRQARLAQGKTVDDVARELNLSARHILALESGDYQSLPGATYVRGYLRRYAGLLGLSPESMLESFNRLPMATRQNDLVVPAPVRQISSSDSLIKLGTLLVVGLIIGLAVVWWQGQEHVTPPRDLAAVPPVALAPAPPTAEPTTPPSEDTAAVRPADTAPVRASAEPPATARPSTAAPAPPASEAVPVNIDPNAPRARLVLYVMEESWADVRDAYQRRLLYETVPAGRVVTLEGAVPLNVFLGNVDGVRVEFDGREYDTRRHKRGQIARFSLGDPGARP